MQKHVLPRLYRMTANQLENGDWHTPLTNCLARALERTTSAKLKAAMEVLTQELAKIDECAHSITVTAKLPANVSLENIAEALSFEHDLPTSVEMIGHSDMVKVITDFRSSKSYAEETAVSNLKDAVKYCLSDPAIEWPVQIYLDS